MANIELTRGKISLIDDDDYARVSQFVWCANQCAGKWYAQRRANNKIIYLHRFIMNAGKGFEVDHINGDGLDNRKENLRICTHADNLRAKRPQRGSTSVYRGVYWYKRHEKWVAKVQRLDDVHFLGYFADEKDAARAYNKKAQELFGDFAYQNPV